MEVEGKSTLGIAAFSLALFALLLLLVVLFVVYSGIYNVAASDDHTAPMRWALTTSMEKSVKRRAPEAPPVFDAAMRAAGATEYKAMCEHCHGGPGVAPRSWSRGMLPQPPHLHEVIGKWQPSEVFWIVKHGLKMTGMPAFGADHDDDAIWNIAAFATQLPGMTTEEYQRLGRSPAPAHHH